MRARQIISEASRSAPLYHATALNYALAIIAGNALGVPGTHRGSNQVSASRSYQKAYDIAEAAADTAVVVFVLDQAKLTTRFRITPFHDAHWQNGGVYDPSDDRTDEQEEVIHGIVRPLDRYLMSINVNPALLDRALKDNLSSWIWRDLGSPDQVAALIASLKQHPLLNRFAPRTA